MQETTESLLPVLDVAGLIIAYLVVAGLLLSLNLFSSWNWLVKSAMNIVVVLFFLVTYLSWPGILGWPTGRDLPRQFYLYAVNVDEPHRIYLWGADIESGLEKAVPRSYELPYSTKLHEGVTRAASKLRKGLPVIGQVSPLAGINTELSTLEQVQATHTEIVFIDAPQGLVPDKD